MGKQVRELTRAEVADDGRHTFTALLTLIILLAALFAPAARAQDDATISDIELEMVRAVERARILAVEKVYHTVVAIYGLNRQGGGSGVVYDPEGYALTNYHVVAGAGAEGWGGLADGKLYKWKLIGVDPGGDLAIIKLEGKEKFHYAELGDSDRVRVGDFVMAMGNPFILAEDQTPTVTLGIVSGNHRYQPGTGPTGTLLEYGNCIQIDSSINPGNSGGPLFNMQGQIIGINGRGSFEERGRVNVGVGYAISANQCKTFIPDMLATKTCRHGTLEASFERRGDREAICSEINLDSAIAKAGLQLGDQLVRFNGWEITTANQFKNLICTLPADWPVEVVWQRDGKEQSAWVRLASLAYPKPQQRPQPQPQPQPKPKEEEPKEPSPVPKEDQPKDSPLPKDDAPKDSPLPKDTPLPKPGEPTPEPPKENDGNAEPSDEVKRKLEALKRKDAEAARKVAEIIENQKNGDDADKKESDAPKDEPVDKDQPKDEPVDGPKKDDGDKDDAEPKPDQPQPDPRRPGQPNPRRILPQRPQLKLEFGRIRDQKLNHAEALRVLRQWRDFAGGAQLDEVAAVRRVVETRKGDQVAGTFRFTTASDGRFRNEDARDGSGDAWNAYAIFDGETLVFDLDTDQPTVLEGRQARLHDTAAFSRLYANLLAENPADHFKSITLEGSGKAQGRRAFRLIVEDDAGNTFYVWLSLLNEAGDDFETRLLKVARANGEQPSENVMLFDDYRLIDSVRIPHRTRYAVSIAEHVAVTTQTVKVELLKELPENTFQLPADLKGGE